MAQQIINLGATGSGAGGDSARTAFEKAIANFAELYIAALPGTAAQKQAARDMFGLGTAATRAAQTGADDATPGAVLLAGAFGWGTLTATTVTDIDAVRPNQIVRMAGGAAGNPFGATGCTVLTFAEGSGWGWQLASPNGGTSRSTFKYRVKVSSTTWGAWVGAYHEGTILGSVSQAAGVPTGAIFERGTNANGDFIKYADGTQECWTKTSGDATADKIWTFPAQFISPPACFATPRTGSNGATATTRATETVSSVPFAIFDVAGSRIANGVNLRAIGRWFN